MAPHRLTLPPSLHNGQLSLLGSRINHLSSLGLRPWLTNHRHLFGLLWWHFHWRLGHLCLPGPRTERPPSLSRLLKPPDNAELFRLCHPLHPYAFHQAHLPSPRVKRTSSRAGIRIRAHSRTFHLFLHLIANDTVLCYGPTSYMVRFSVGSGRCCCPYSRSFDTIYLVGVGVHRHLLGDGSSLLGEVYDQLGVSC